MFQLVFWVGAALLLFLYGLSYGHWKIALIRNLYFPIVGFLLSGSMTFFYGHRIFRQFGHPILLIGAVSGVAALLTATILNPVTFSLLGSPITEMPLKIVSTDTLYFGLFYFVWSLLYLRHAASADAEQAGEGMQINVRNITVEVRGEVRTLEIADLECVCSSGDYVELMTDKGVYLKKQTLSKFEHELPPGGFARIHRTTIVNKEKIVSVKPKGRGVFEISLAGGATVQSSRSYRHAIDGLLPKA